MAKKATKKPVKKAAPKKRTNPAAGTLTALLLNPGGNRTMAKRKKARKSGSGKKRTRNPVTKKANPVRRKRRNTSGAAAKRRANPHSHAKHYGRYHHRKHGRHAAKRAHRRRRNPGIKWGAVFKAGALLILGVLGGSALIGGVWQLLKDKPVNPIFRGAVELGVGIAIAGFHPVQEHLAYGFGGIIGAVGLAEIGIGLTAGSVDTQETIKKFSTAPNIAEFGYTPTVSVSAWPRFEQESPPKVSGLELPFGGLGEVALDLNGLELEV